MFERAEERWRAICKEMGENISVYETLVPLIYASLFDAVADLNPQSNLLDNLNNSDLILLCAYQSLAAWLINKSLQSKFNKSGKTKRRMIILIISALIALVAATLSFIGFYSDIAWLKLLILLISTFVISIVLYIQKPKFDVDNAALLLFLLVLPPLFYFFSWTIITNLNSITSTLYNVSRDLRTLIFELTHSDKYSLGCYIFAFIIAAISAEKLSWKD